MIFVFPIECLGIIPIVVHTPAVKIAKKKGTDLRLCHTGNKIAAIGKKTGCGNLLQNKLLVLEVFCKINFTT